MPLSPDLRKKVASLLRDAATPLRKLAGDITAAPVTERVPKPVINIDNLRSLLLHDNR